MTFDAVLRAESRLLGSSRARAGVYESVHRAAKDLVPVDAFYVCLYEPKNRRLRFEHYGDEDGLDTPEAFPLGDGPTSRAIRSGKAFVLNHHREESGPVYLFGDPSRQSKATIHLPFWDGSPCLPGAGAAAGVLSVQSYSLDAYGREHVASVRWLAARAAAMLRDTESEAACEASRIDEDATARARLAERVEGLLAEHGAAPDLRRALREALRLDAEPTVDPSLLTDRELQTASLAAQGLSYARVADALGIGRETVKTYLPRAYAKLGLADGRSLCRHLPTLLAALVQRGL